MTEKERMLAGENYNPLDDELRADMARCKCLLYKFNNLLIDDLGERIDVLRELLGSSGEQLYIEPPFYCDYGCNIHIGDNFYANYNLHVLDCAEVTIGDNVFIGPMAGLYTAGHPVDADARRRGIEFAKPITIGSDVWIGGGVTINPGVTIGSNVVIGSGSVVTKDIPDNVIAVGNPCRVMRPISESDRKYWSEQIERYTEETGKQI